LAGKIKELEDGVISQDAKAEYYQTNRTLSGFKFQKRENPELKEQYAGSQQPPVANLLKGPYTPQERIQIKDAATRELERRRSGKASVSNQMPQPGGG